MECEQKDTPTAKAVNQQESVPNSLCLLTLVRSLHRTNLYGRKIRDPASSCAGNKAGPRKLTFINYLTVNLGERVFL